MRKLLAGWMAVAALGGCGAAFGGTEVKTGPEVEVATPPTIISTAENPTVRDQRKLPGEILRCWQNGRLIYEAGGFKAGADKSVAVPVPRAVEGEPVNLFDLRDGLCILSTN
jgi:hypothetical protein